MDPEVFLSSGWAYAEYVVSVLRFVCVISIYELKSHERNWVGLGLRLFQQMQYVSDQVDSNVSDDYRRMFAIS